MKKLLSIILDLFLGIVGTGWLLTRISGGERTIDLYNLWFLIWIISIILYFTLLKKHLGQSLGSKLLKIKPSKKK
jgi:hypothetical protein